VCVTYKYYRTERVLRGLIRNVTLNFIYLLNEFPCTITDKLAREATTSITGHNLSNAWISNLGSNRQVLNQSLSQVTTGLDQISGRILYNRRKLRELPLSLIYANKLDDCATVLLDFSFLSACVHERLGQDVVKYCLTLCKLGKFPFVQLVANVFWLGASALQRDHRQVNVCMCVVYVCVVCIYVCMCVYMCCVCVYVLCMFVCCVACCVIYVCVYVCVYVCMYIKMYVWVYILWVYIQHI